MIMTGPTYSLINFLLNITSKALTKHILSKILMGDIGKNPRKSLTITINGKISQNTLN